MDDDHAEIWLEPRAKSYGGEGRCWAGDDPWGNGVRYVRADLAYEAAKPAAGGILPVEKLADAIEACDWSSPSIGNTAILRAAVRVLRSFANPAPTSPSEAVVEALRAYEAWEADVIMSADWSRETPLLTQEQWDWLVEIQGKRNAALSSAPDAKDAP